MSIVFSIEMTPKNENNAPKLDLEPLSANSFAEMPETVFVVEGYPASDSDERLGVIDISGDKLVVYATESDPTEFLAKFSRDGSTKELVVENVGGGLKDWFRRKKIGLQHKREDWSDKRRAKKRAKEHPNPPKNTRKNKFASTHKRVDPLGDYRTPMSRKDRVEKQKWQSIDRLVSDTGRR